jgi:hypothetical protein
MLFSFFVQCKEQSIEDIVDGPGRREVELVYSM